MPPLPSLPEYPCVSPPLPVPHVLVEVVHRNRQPLLQQWERLLGPPVGCRQTRGGRQTSRSRGMLSLQRLRQRCTQTSCLCSARCGRPNLPGPCRGGCRGRPPPGCPPPPAWPTLGARRVPGPQPRHSPAGSRCGAFGGRGNPVGSHLGVGGMPRPGHGVWRIATGPPARQLPAMTDGPARWRCLLRRRLCWFTCPVEEVPQGELVVDEPNRRVVGAILVHQLRQLPPQHPLGAIQIPSLRHLRRLGRQAAGRLPGRLRLLVRAAGAPAAAAAALGAEAAGTPGAPQCSCCRDAF